MGGWGGWGGWSEGGAGLDHGFGFETILRCWKQDQGKSVDTRQQILKPVVVAWLSSFLTEEAEVATDLGHFALRATNVLSTPQESNLDVNVAGHLWPGSCSGVSSFDRRLVFSSSDVWSDSRTPSGGQIRPNSVDSTVKEAAR